MFSALNRTEYIRIRAGITVGKAPNCDLACALSRRTHIALLSIASFLLPTPLVLRPARPLPAFLWPRLSPWPCRSLARRLDLELRHRRRGGWQLQPSERERESSQHKERASNILHFLTGKGGGVGKPAKAGLRPWPLEQGQRARHQTCRRREFFQAS